MCSRLRWERSKLLNRRYWLDFFLWWTLSWPLNIWFQGIPQRINGKVSGKINGVSFQDEDLHSYVVTSDGRAYTAVSKMNESIGFDLQPLSMLGGVVGWLFARSTSTSAPNGYQLTGTFQMKTSFFIKLDSVYFFVWFALTKGGKFNFTTTIDFPQTGHRVVIEQRFHGVDVFNYLRMSINVFGTVPSISHGSKIEISDYEEEHHKTGLGTDFISCLLNKWTWLWLLFLKGNSDQRVGERFVLRVQVSTYHSVSITLFILKNAHLHR